MFFLFIVMTIVFVGAVNFYINLKSDQYTDQKIEDTLEDFEKNISDEDILNNSDGIEESEDTEKVLEEKEVEQNVEVEVLKKEEDSVEQMEIKNVSLEVPFSAQAPFGNWSDVRKQEGCEEAVVIMAMAWVRGEGLTPQEADDRINEISVLEEKELGTFQDTSAKDTVEIIFQKYYKYDNVEIIYEIGKDDIKAELSKGNLILVPTNGRLLMNPNYTPPGPTTHYLLVSGYDPLAKEFITHDPGTRNGEKYRYDEDILESALLDYPTGSHEKIEEEKTAMIIVRKEN